MLEITPDNALDYLRSLGHLGPGPARVEALGWGVSNVVLRVETGGRLFVLKQSRPQLRTRDAWFSDLDRVYRELEVMQTLGPLLPAGVVPEVLFVDRPNYAFAMSHAPLEARVSLSANGDLYPLLERYSRELPALDVSLRGAVSSWCTSSSSDASRRSASLEWTSLASRSIPNNTKRCRSCRWTIPRRTA